MTILNNVSYLITNHSIIYDTISRGVSKQKNRENIA